MRLVGTIPDQHDASTFVDFLLTRDISAKVEQTAEGWQLWVRDEDRVAEAKDELRNFEADRNNEKYRNAAKEADRLRRDRATKAIEARRNVIQLPRSGGAGARGPRPLTMLLLAASTVVFVMSDFGQTRVGFDRLQITTLHPLENGMAQWFYGLPEVRHGEVWRLFSPMLIHFSLIHFLGNMLLLVDFGSQIETRRGTLTFAALAASSSLACNLSEYWWSGPNFGGMSGVDYGLFGYLLIKTKFEPRLGFVLSPTTTTMAIAWFVLCMTGVVGNVANAGHAGGLAAGLVFAYVPIALRSIRGK